MKSKGFKLKVCISFSFENLWKGFVYYLFSSLSHLTVLVNFSLIECFVFILFILWSWLLNLHFYQLYIFFRCLNNVRIRWGYKKCSIEPLFVQQNLNSWTFNIYEQIWMCIYDIHPSQCTSTALQDPK